MNMLRLIIFALPLIIAISNVPNAFSETTIYESWDSIHGKLSESIDLIREKGDVPASTWVPWKSDKKSIDKEINELVDEALVLLGKTEFSEIKNRINGLQDNITETNKKIAVLKTKLLGAPKDVAAWKVWKKDSDDYKKSIIDYKNRISENKKEIDRLKSRLVEEFKKIGVNVNRDQVDTLISSITSDDDIQMISVFNSVKMLTVKLKDLTVESSENPENAKRYYGMHTILLKILLRLHERYVSNINDKYLPKLDEIIQKNIELGKQTKKLLAAASEKHKPIYKANFKAQKVTHKTAILYETYLNDNRERIMEIHAKLVPEYEAALNTYNTVTTAHDLITLMKTANNMFDNLSELQTPKLLVFENKEMKKEFNKITLKMKQ